MNTRVRNTPENVALLCKGFSHVGFRFHVDGRGCWFHRNPRGYSAGDRRQRCGSVDGVWLVFPPYWSGEVARSGADYAVVQEAR